VGRGKGDVTGSREMNVQCTVQARVPKEGIVILPSQQGDDTPRLRRAGVTGKRERAADRNGQTGQSCAGPDTPSRQVTRHPMATSEHCGRHVGGGQGAFTIRQCQASDQPALSTGQGSQNRPVAERGESQLLTSVLVILI
jgi:hypothetical protein